MEHSSNAERFHEPTGCSGVGGLSLTSGRSLHLISLITTVLTFPLIFMGGLVTSHGAGMSVPDWPNTWGYNMFMFPPSKWIGGIWYEHTHRLAASFIGSLCILIVVVAWMTDRRKIIRWTAVGILVAVCAQGALGGFRVVLSDRDLAIVHGCAAQLFFCFLATFCVMTAPRRRSTPVLSPAESRSLRKIFILSIIATGVVLIQLVIGAIMRHLGAGLAIPDFPTSYGRLIPPWTIDDAFRQAAIHQYGVDLGLNRLTSFLVWIHFAHRMGALAVTTTLGMLCGMVLIHPRRPRPLARLAWILIVLLVTQITLGILTVLLRKPADIASLHVAVGALVLMTTWITCVNVHISRRGSHADKPVAIVYRQPFARQAASEVSIDSPMVPDLQSTGV